MLLLVSNRDDLTTDFLVLELESRDAPFLRFNTEDYPSQVTLRWRGGEAELRIGDADVEARTVTGVWWRRPSGPALPQTLTHAEARWAAGESAAALEGFFRTLDARWVSRPVAIAAAECKMEQLVRAREAGFDTPRSLVTNDRATAREFVDAHHAVVSKSLHSGRIPVPGGTALFYTSPVLREHLADEEPFGPEPSLLQEYVPKQYDVRVTVIGDTAYACRIDSQPDADAQTDWRRGDLEAMLHTIESIPAAVANRCIALTHAYGLRFSAIDLARHPDGRYSSSSSTPMGSGHGSRSCAAFLWRRISQTSCWGRRREPG